MGKEECFGCGVPPPFPGAWGGRGIIKVLSENEDLVPAPGVAGDTPPRTQGPVTPPRVWYIQGGSRLPWRANKGVQGPAQSAAMGYGGPSPKHSPLEKRGGASPTQFLVRGSCAIPQKLGTGTVLKTCWEKGWSRDHKSFRDQRSRSQQAPVNQTSKSKSPRRGGLGEGGLGSLAVGRAGSESGSPSPGAWSPVHDAVTVQSHKVDLAASPRAD